MTLKRNPKTDGPRRATHDAATLGAQRMQMAQLVRKGWPFYLVTNSEVRRLPFRLVDVVLISASFAFARSFCSHLEANLDRPLGVIRVTYCNRCMPVRSQPRAFVEQLDNRWCRPPPVTEAAYCVLCIKPETSKCNVSTPMMPTLERQSFVLHVPSCSPS